jgi:hypothetical protein
MAHARTLAVITTPDGALGYARRWAGGELLADQPWPGFRVGDVRSRPRRAGVPEKDAWTSSGVARLAGALRRFVVAATTGRLRVVVEGAVTFRLDVPAGRLDLLDGEPESALAAELLLGTALALDLAAHDTFALDASAVSTRDGAILVAGAPGSGKSRLSQALGAHPGWTWRADNVAVLARDGALVELRTQFPQWQAVPVWPPSDVDALPVRAILVLAHGPVWRLEPLDHAQALRAFVAGTVAAPLFPPRIAEAQLAFGAELVRRTRWLRLTMPDYTGRPGDLADAAALALAGLA